MQDGDGYNVAGDEEGKGNRWRGQWPKIARDENGKCNVDGNKGVG